MRDASRLAEADARIIADSFHEYEPSWAEGEDVIAHHLSALVPVGWQPFAPGRCMRLCTCRARGTCALAISTRVSNAHKGQCVHAPRARVFTPVHYACMVEMATGLRRTLRTRTSFCKSAAKMFHAPQSSVAIFPQLSSTFSMG